MKKSILIIFLLVAMLSVSVYGADRVDMIVLLDNSVSVLPIYNDIQESLLKRIISEHLNPGDTFSLLTFADYPEVEISREIKNEDDIQEILNYSAILQPMGNYTDLVLALRFLYKYTLDLPLNNKKKIVILTDGIHDPPPGSPYIFSNPADAETEVKKVSDEIHREGWDVSIVEIESQDDTVASSGSGAADSGEGSEKTTTADAGPGPSDESPKANFIDTVAESLGSEPNKFSSEEKDMAGIALGIPLVSVPDELGSTSGSLTVPLTVYNRSNRMILFSLSSVIYGGNDLLEEKASMKLDPKETKILDIELNLPEDLSFGNNSIEVSLKLVGGLETEPDFLRLNFNLQEKTGLKRSLDFITDWRFLAILAGVIIALIVIILVKRTPAPKKGVSDAEEYEYNATVAAAVTEEINDTDEKSAGQNGKTREPEEYLIAAITTDTDEPIPTKKNRPIQMMAYGQNTKLGISNVKWLGLNRKRSIGSSSSSIFRIFFLKVPSTIAYIECTGDDFIFTPEIKEYFPDLDGPMHNCLNKKIRVVNKDSHLFYIEFRQWISELEKINRILSMTKHSGAPDTEF